MSKTKDLLVTIPFDVLINQLFGDEVRYYVPIHPIVADVLEYHIKNVKIELLYKVQRIGFTEISRFTDYKEEKLEWPRLWFYNDWYNSEQNYLKRKAYSEKERIEAEILSRNLKVVSRAYMEFTGVTDRKVADAKAYSLLKGNKIASIKMLGVALENLITDKSQL